MPCRLISFAGNSVAVTYDGPRAQKVIEFLFAYTSAEESIPPYTTFQVTTHPQNGNLVLHRDGDFLGENESDGELAEYLMGEVTFRLLDKSRGGITLHAGALAWKGKGILLPGSIGAGKTTLTAWLLNKGFDYLTDEMVWVPEGTNALNAFPRPLNLKKPSRRVVADFLDFEQKAPQILSSSRMDLIAPTAIRPDNRWSAPPLGWFLFPRYKPEAKPRVQPLSKAQAGFALSSGLLNVGNLADRGFSEVARLARSAPAFRLHYSRLEEIEEQLEQILD